MVELLSHFGCDLLSFLAVSLQVFDLHRQRAVPHHQHRLLVWEQRQTRTSDQRRETRTARRQFSWSVGQTMSRRTHRSDSCLLGVFDPKPAPHSSSLVFLFMKRKRKRHWGLTGRLVLMQRLNETIMTTKNRVGRKTYSEYVDKLWAACWVASHIPSHNNPDRLWINKKEMQYYGFVLPIQPPSFLFLFIFLLCKCLQCCLINP